MYRLELLIQPDNCMPESESKYLVRSYTLLVIFVRISVHSKLRNTFCNIAIFMLRSYQDVPRHGNIEYIKEMEVV